MKNKKIPLRSCVVTREKLPKSELLRIVRTPDGKIVADLTGKLNGRGAYIKKDNSVLDKAIKSGALSRQLEVKISDDDYEKYSLYLRDDYRLDKTLIEVVEELGEEASGMCGNLKVVEIPDNCFYKIDEYDGVETIYYSESEIKEK